MRSILDDIQQRPKAKGGSVHGAILANLREILSTPRASARALMDLGITDVTQVYCEYPDALTPFQEELLATVRKYEPRLKGVRIVAVPFDDRDLRLRFDVKGWFEDEHGHVVSTSYRTAIHSDNDVSF